MPTKHVTQQIEAYLDNQFSPKERQRIEDHLAICPICLHYLLDAKQLVDQLGPVMRKVLGEPAPPPALRYRVRHALETTPTSHPPHFSWTVPGRVLNTAGTLIIISLLAFGAFAAIQGQLPQNDVSTIDSLQPGQGGGEEVAAATNTAPPTPEITPATPQTLKISSLGDTLPRVRPTPTQPAGDSSIVANFASPTPFPIPKESSATEETEPPMPSISEPDGTIAFSFFNMAPERQIYEIHLIEANGANHRLFPLDGVSEPALRLTVDGHQLAYRAWGEPTSPRGLLSSGLSGELPDTVSDFWEDAQPDWSPTENRLIFASQRETDRRWRLYSSWGDGSLEVNLRREGKSPTFAPDGYRFAFVSCDSTDNHCGLWVGDLDNSEYGSKPFLEDPLAQAPDWSPVAEQIAYMANPDDNWDLYLVNSNGSDVRRLTTDPAADGLPVWSPDGEWLAFLSNRNGNWGIWLLHITSGQLRQLFNFDGGTFIPPNRPPYEERQWGDEQLSWSQ